jgi:threonine/homoserine/homoserine lactone efflux protein
MGARLPSMLAFLAISAVVIVTPGPDTALTIRNALLGDRRGGIRTAMGVAGGQACWTLATSAGIAALLSASRPAFLALRLLGAAYLVWLGAASLLAAWRGQFGHHPVPGTYPVRARYMRQGLLSNLSNPKMAVFFTSLLPQFGHSFAALLALGLVFSCLTLLWLTAYGITVARAGDFLRRGWVRRALDALTGAVLVALGARLATERR